MKLAADLLSCFPGITCLFIAAKIEEIYPPKLREFAHVTDGACCEDDIVSMELAILQELSWGVGPMTPNAWVKVFLQASRTFSYIKTAAGQDLVRPLFSGSHFIQVMRLLDVAILDIGSLTFPYSILAASAIYIRFDPSTALQSSGSYLLANKSSLRHCFCVLARRSLISLSQQAGGIGQRN